MEESQPAKMEEETNYDLSLSLNRMSDLIDGKCKIKCQVKEFTGVKVGVIGYYNVGKTYFINSLAGINLPNGFQNTTDFLALKEVKIGDANYILYDTAGKGQPVDVRTPSEHTNRAAVEDLLDCLLADQVDYFIIVLNDLTHQDQLFITKIADFFASNKASEKPRLIVIHNWRYVRVGGIIPHFKKYVEPMYEGRTNKNLDNVHPEKGEYFYFNTKETLSGDPIFVDHFIVVGEKSVDDNNQRLEDYERERLYNRNVFNFIREAFGHWFPGMKMHEKYNVVNDLQSSFNRLGGKYFTAEREIKNDDKNNNNNNNNNNLDNINNIIDNKNIIIEDNEKENKVGDIKPEFEIVDCTIIAKKAKGYQFNPKTFPLFVMLSQFPTTLNTPKIFYQKDDKDNQIEYMIAHVECPGLSFVEINSQKHKYWTIKLTKEPLAYQRPEPNVSIINDRTKAPSYGNSELMIAFPEDFVPDLKNYKVFYEQGILVVQILHQRLNGVVEDLHLLPWDFSRNCIGVEINKTKEKLESKELQIKQLQNELAAKESLIKTVNAENAKLKIDVQAIKEIENVVDLNKDKKQTNQSSGGCIIL